jgi:acyl dehydratase
VYLTSGAGRRYDPHVPELFALHEVHVGQDVGGRELTLRAADVARYAAGTGGDPPAPEGAPIAPALLLHSEVYRSLAWYLPNVFGNLHARQEWELFAPLPLDAAVRTRATVVERYPKRNREYVVSEVLVTDAAGRWLQRSRTHQSFLIEDGRRDTVVDRDRARRPDRQFTIGEGPGDEIPALTRPITLAMCEAFSGPEKNYHNDREMARMLGFPDIVVQGMMSVCLVADLMSEAFGLGWLCAGKMDVRLVNVVWVGDVLAVRGKVREESPEGSRRRVHLDVWCEKADGTKTLVGQASALR